MSLKDKGYEALKVLGKGTFGSALLVRKSGTNVALVAKEIDLRKLGKRDVEASRNEVAMLRALNHPNITKFNEGWEHDKRVYIIMEYADGGDLAGKIKAQKTQLRQPFTQEQILGYFIQICLSLKYLHKQHILHRDLKTMNVFLTSSDVVKLGDFGVAKQLGTVGVTRTVCGTPYYFSPEMCRSEPYSNKCDVWALGVILYELIMLTKPFVAADIKALMAVITGGHMRPMENFQGHSDQLRELCKCLLALDSQKRPSISSIMGTPFMQTNLKQFVKAIRDKEQTAPGLAKQGWADQKAPPPGAAAPPAASSPPRGGYAGGAPGSPGSPGGGKGMRLGKMKAADLKAMTSAPPAEYEAMKAAQAPPKEQKPRTGQDLGCHPDLAKTIADCQDMQKLAEEDGGEDEGHFGDHAGQVSEATIPLEEIKDQLIQELGPEKLQKCFQAYAELGTDEAKLEEKLNLILGDKVDLLPHVEHLVFHTAQS